MIFDHFVSDSSWSDELNEWLSNCRKSSHKSGVSWNWRYYKVASSFELDCNVKESDFKYIAMDLAVYLIVIKRISYLNALPVFYK